MAAVQYATREQLKAALDVKETYRNSAQLDRVLVSSSRAIEGQLHRIFYPLTATKSFEYPQRNRRGPSWRLWLDANELYSVSTLVAGGTTIVAADYFLEPQAEGPPYNRIEIDLASTASFKANTGTRQRSIVITGVFCGCDVVEESVGALSSNLDADITDTASITWTSARVGVGDILKIDSERMIVTEKTMVDTTQDLQSSLTAVNSATAVAVTTGASFAVDQVILIDSERMLVVDISGNTLTVKRGWDGSTLATHTQNTSIYGLTGVELARAQLGTTLGAHLTSATIYRYAVPGLINDLCVAEALSQLGQETSGYARVIGSGDNQREAVGKGLEDVRKQAYAAYGRKARMRSV